ncbi:MAG TPA: beta-1,6-N-acetylglucosaminyltransferase, partial [Burkholderiaceae bacterium]|nr:beta-1,6-N-acetylglucosaminyltransferase [Burkholderiaceae bacterium]
MKLAVLLLCHESPALIARRLDSAFYRSPHVKVYLHHDRASPHHDRAAFEAAMPGGLQWHWLDDAVRARWGAYSLVEATLRLARAALGDAAFGCDRLLLASGTCRPLHSFATLDAFLEARPGIEFIQAHDLSTGRWTKGGLEEERFEFYFPFNYATQRRRFELFTALQRRLGVRRRMPAGLRPHFGSQWWCLTRGVLQGVVDLLARPELARFFARCWIPDEFAIQTAVAHLCPARRIAGHGLTYYEFDAGGRPLVLEDWHVEHVRRQPFFFARKLSPAAPVLEAALESDVVHPDSDMEWFARVGTPTPDFQRHLDSVRDDRSLRAWPGSFRPEEGAAMAANTRRYYVLVGSSRAHVARVLARARALSRRSAAVPILDFPFGRPGLQPAPDRLHGWGLGPGDRLRARHDELAVLTELVHLDPRQFTVLGLETLHPSFVLEQVIRDPHAVVVDCDPPGLDRAQRAALALRHVGGAHEAWLSSATRRALAENTPLPQDALAIARARGVARCRYASPSDATAFDDLAWQLIS